MSDSVVVIRSVEERTEQACLDIVRAQVGADTPVHIVRNKPFAEAHVESMRLAVHSATKWALFLDADVLLRRNAIPDMLDEANAIPGPFYMLNFQVLDRGFDGPAYGGVHLYSVAHLRSALQLTETIYDVQRPESHLCIEMAHRARVPSLRSARLVGLHGYEQFYTDLYRTTFVRAVKFARHTNYLLRLYRSRYESDSGGDFEYRVMLWGLLDGMIYRGSNSQAPLDKAQYEDKALAVLALLGLRERGTFSSEGYPIDQIINGHVPNEHYHEIAGHVCPAGDIAVGVPDRSMRRLIRRIVRSPRTRLKRIVEVALHG